ncbi:Receptor expression-enhancing protein [Dirofilaria immitis]
MRSSDVVYNLAVVLDTMGKVIHPVAYMNISAFLQRADEERSGVVSTMNSSLELWANPLIDTAIYSIELGINREQLICIILIIFAFYLSLGCFAELICNIFGFAYPAYASVKAIRTPNKDDDTQWLMYWTVFATFSIADSMISIITNFLPAYWLFKAAFLLYLHVPNSNGTRMLFYKIVNPIISIIDDFIISYQSKQCQELKRNNCQSINILKQYNGYIEIK